MCIRDRRKRVLEANRDEIVEELVPGCVVDRNMIDGDITMFNRSPALHRMSEMAHIIRVLPGKTFRLNPCSTNPYNADFDGDEMNIHFPQQLEAKVEAAELMAVEKQIISPRHGEPIIALAEDWIAGIGIMTMSNTSFSKSEAMDMAMICGSDEIPKPKPGKEERWDGKQLLNLLMPKNINLRYDSTAHKLLKRADLCKPDCGEKCPHDAYVIIEKGVIKQGIIDKASVAPGGKLLLEVTRENEPEFVLNFYNRLSRLTAYVLSRKGITLTDAEFTAKDPKIKERVVREAIKKGHEIVEKYRGNEMDARAGLTYEESFEANMLEVAAKAQDKTLKDVLTAGFTGLI
ncbi:MAG: DNA-directed RNA polymerase subunit A', partial [Candidatus Diapherotrites archaeon]|nr:DNA-directed RNA polymerase subunit A' [Candidatus Diapherotrites archaeon]